MISSGRPIQSGAEAIAQPACELLAELGLDTALGAAGAEVVDGFENAWDESEVQVKPGRWVHVDRRALADRALEEAVRRGALVDQRATLPRWDNNFPFLATIDATGRSAAWSRPIRRVGNEVATIFRLENPTPGRGRIARMNGRWAYFIGSNSAPTAGIIGRGPQELDEPVRDKLNISGDARLVGKRPAFPQWCVQPVAQRRLAIGDAALAYNPLAGQGIRFALASAFSAAAVVRTWRDDPGATESASEYYRHFVESARRAHLDFLSGLETGAERKQGKPNRFPARVSFTGKIITANVNRDSRVVCEEALETVEGKIVRWAGGFDLLCLRDMAQMPLHTADLIENLARASLTREEATLLVAWCLERRILS